MEFFDQKDDKMEFFNQEYQNLKREKVIMAALSGDFPEPLNEIFYAIYDDNPPTVEKDDLLYDILTHPFVDETLVQSFARFVRDSKNSLSDQTIAKICFFSNPKFPFFPSQKSSRCSPKIGKLIFKFSKKEKLHGQKKSIPFSFILFNTFLCQEAIVTLTTTRWRSQVHQKK